MIPVKRGKEPQKLKNVRASQLAKLRPLVAASALTSDDIIGYRCVAEDLWQAQHHKCCYCERIIEADYYDVEHYRPKALAERAPGSAATHGYWWLAFTWSNLLFSCKACNEKYKKNKFPLQTPYTLMAEQAVNAREKPLLLDPASSKVNPVEHIIHVPCAKGWEPEPRNGSPWGFWTIEVCGLMRDQLHDLRKNHVKNIVKPHADALLRSLKRGDPAQIDYDFQRAVALFKPDLAHAALSYDALCYFVPATDIAAAIGKTWPAPSEVCR